MHDAASAISADRPYQPRTEPAVGAQLLAVYFGSPTCGFCTQPAFKAAIRRVGPLLAAQAAARAQTFHWAAVAVAWNAREGFEYLAELGPFDEIAAGGQWWNTIVAQRLFGAGRAATPALLLYERTIEQRVAENTLVFSERLIGRSGGSQQIEHWVAQGAPLGAVALSQDDV